MCLAATASWPVANESLMRRGSKPLIYLYTPADASRGTGSFCSDAAPWQLQVASWSLPHNGPEPQTHPIPVYHLPLADSSFSSMSATARASRSSSSLSDALPEGLVSMGAACCTRPAPAACVGPLGSPATLWGEGGCTGRRGWGGCRPGGGGASIGEGTFVGRPRPPACCCCCCRGCWRGAGCCCSGCCA